MPAIATRRAQPRRFVPNDLDALDLDAVSALYDALDARDTSTRDALEEWILDWEELTAVLTEAYAEAYVDMTSDTANPDFEQRYIDVVEKVVPVSEQRGFALKEKLLASPALDRLGEEYLVFLRKVRAEMQIFREENIPLLTEEKKLDQEFEKISGAQKAEFRGEVYTLPEIVRFLEEPDRATRREAWLARAEVKLADATKLDELYDRMVAVRQEIARNAGFGNYREYKWIEQKRFDYTPDDCLAFHDAIEKYIVPVVQEDNERRKAKLRIETLRPWDILVDPHGHEPPRPFDSVGRLKEGSERVLQRVDPELGSYFHTMMEEGLLDLESRPGKSPGGYMMSFPDKRVPFIFMNAVGTKRDVDTMLHEGGHAFHYFLARQQPLFSYHHTGLEFAGVASVNLEFLTRPYMS
jgi:oligoendopeptidase F